MFCSFSVLTCFMEYCKKLSKQLNWEICPYIRMWSWLVYIYTNVYHHIYIYIHIYCAYIYVSYHHSIYIYIHTNIYHHRMMVVVPDTKVQMLSDNSSNTKQTEKVWWDLTSQNCCHLDVLPCRKSLTLYTLVSVKHQLCQCEHGSKLI